MRDLATACHAEGRGFESHQPLRISPLLEQVFRFCCLCPRGRSALGGEDLRESAALEAFLFDDALSSAISPRRSPLKISAGPHAAFFRVREKTAFGFSFIAVAIGSSDAAQCGPMIS